MYKTIILKLILKLTIYGEIEMSSLKNLIIVEGNTEEKFFKDFKSKLKYPAKIIVHNLAQNDFNTNIIGLMYNSVSIVLDADILNKTNVDRINSNLKLLNANKVNIYIQNQNFEDELVGSLNECKTLNDLYKLFDCKNKSANEFKRKFLRVSDISKKPNFNINFHMLYCNNEIYKNYFNKGKVQTGKQLFRNK